MPLPQADFQSLKQIPIDQVLARYGVKLRPAGPHTLYGACPLPTHTSRQSRERFFCESFAACLGLPLRLLHRGAGSAVMRSTWWQ
jgi:hypothetical protein